MVLLLVLLGCPASKDSADSGGDSSADSGADSGDSTTDSADSSGDTAADTGCADPSTWYPDADGDGWGGGEGHEACEPAPGEVDVGGDCDDTRADVSPAGIEICDPADADEDCDGAAETDAIAGTSTWYPDGDGDGFGAGEGRVACDPEAGEVDVSGDCDDTDAAAHPGAAPDCEGDGDQDCDGRLDAADEDGDGARSCRDCDDADPARSPAVAEACATPVDDNCDGATNEEGALGCTDRYPDGDGDSWGDGAARCLCEPEDGWTAAADGDCEDTDATVHPEAAEVCADGVDQDCDGYDTCAIAALDRVFVGGEPGSELGTAMAAGGDLDGDGVGDLVLGARLAGGTGRAVLYPGPLGAGMVASVGVLGVESGAAFGQELAVADLDGDGQDDLVVAAPFADPPDRSGGAVYLLDGPLLADTTPDAARFVAFGAVEDYVGIALAAGDDWDADATPDLLLGSYSGGYGALLGHSGAATGARDPAAADFVVQGDRTSDLLGTSLARVGDVDGDGAADVVFGAPFAVRVGAVGLFPGPVSGTVAASDAPGWWEGTVARAGFGESVWPLPDMDGDGVADVAVASHAAVYVLTGLGAGSWTDADAALTLSGVGSYAGEGAVTAADVDGDGTPEVAVGSAYWPDGAGSTLVYGFTAGATLAPPDARATWLGGPSDQLGRALVAPGDVDGDGLGDLLVRAAGDGSAATEVGSGWLIPGALVP